MFGWINGSLEELILERHGAAIWNQIKQDAQCGQYTNKFNRNVDYPDDTTVRLITSASKLLEVSTELIIEELGVSFLHFVRKHGYETTIRRQGSNFHEWLDNMNEPHRLLKSRFPTSSPPKFWVVPRVNENEVELHYYSKRGKGIFASLLVGIVKEVAKFYFNLEAKMQLISTEMLSETLYHGCWVVFSSPLSCPPLLPPIDSSPAETVTELKCPFSGQTVSIQPTLCPHMSQNAAEIPSSSSRLQPHSTPQADDSKKLTPSNNHTNNFGLSPKHVMQYFPFHIVINRNLQITQMGDKLTKFFQRNFTQLRQDVLLADINRFFSIVSPPNSELTWTSLLRLTDCDVELELKDLMLHKAPLLFRGSLTVFQAAVDHNVTEDCIMLFVNPDIKHLEEMDTIHLKLSDFPRHSFQRDLLLIREHLRSETDLTINLHELSNKLDQERTKSLQALRTKGIFVRYASHEIRTPLNITILGLAYLEEEILRLGSQQNTATLREVLMDVQRSCHSAVDILNDLLLYEKLENGGLFIINRANISVGRFLRESTAVFKIQCQSSDIELRIEQDEDIDDVLISVDKTKLSQVLRNFVSNGLKFTPKSGQITVTCNVHSPTASPDIDVRSSPHIEAAEERRFRELTITFAEDFPSGSYPAMGYVRLAVSDTGPGIAAADQQHLFQEFSQVNAEQLQNGQGSGLGLWIAKSITKMHGGRVGVASKLGEGSTFIADIPISSVVSSPARLDTYSSSEEGDEDPDSIGIDYNQSMPLSTSSKFHGDSPSESAKRCVKRTREEDLAEEDLALQRMHPKVSLAVRSPPSSSHLLHMSCSSSVDSISEQQSVLSRSSSSMDYRFIHHDLLEILSKKNVLIVDDIKMNRKIVRRLLQDKFLCIDEAENGLVAVQKVQEAHANAAPFHVIMMDYVMPTMNGLEATRRIREMSCGPTTIILGVTGNGMQTDIDAFLQAGADQVLIKPLNLDCFFDVLHQKLS